MRCMALCLAIRDSVSCIDCHGVQYHLSPCCPACLCSLSSDLAAQLQADLNKVLVAVASTQPPPSSRFGQEMDSQMASELELGMTAGRVTTSDLEGLVQAAGGVIAAAAGQQRRPPVTPPQRSPQQERQQAAAAATLAARREMAPPAASPQLSPGEQQRTAAAASAAAAAAEHMAQLLMVRSDCFYLRHCLHQW